MAKYQVNHTTIFDYEMPVAVSHHAARLTPLENERQSCQLFKLEVDPKPDERAERKDFFGNTLIQFSVQSPHSRLAVECNSEVTVQPLQLPIAELTPTCAEVRETILHDLSHSSIEALQFTYPSPNVPLTDEVARFAAPFFSDEKRFLYAASDLAAHIHETFEFDPSATDVSTPVDEVLSIKRGVCQDFAHLMIAAIRAMRLPARYVSGYILTHPPAGQPRLTGADASHAWVSIYLPQFGWVDIDPTNRQLCSEEHITLAAGRDFSDVSLIAGAVTGGGNHLISIEVTVTPLSKPESLRCPLPSSQTEAETTTEEKETENEAEGSGI